MARLRITVGRPKQVSGFKNRFPPGGKFVKIKVKNHRRTLIAMMDPYYHAESIENAYRDSVMS